MSEKFIFSFGSAEIVEGGIIFTLFGQRHFREMSKNNLKKVNEKVARRYLMNPTFWEVDNWLDVAIKMRD